MALVIEYVHAETKQLTVHKLDLKENNFSAYSLLLILI